MFLIIWWYRSPWGPAGRYRFGIIQLGWEPNPKGAGGRLTLGLDRTPPPALQGGAVGPLSGVELKSSSTLPYATSQKVEVLLPQIVGAAIASVDPSSNTVATAADFAPPTQWPGGSRWTTAASGAVRLSPRPSAP